MFRFLFLSDSFRHPAEFAARAFDRALRLLLLRDVHLRQGLDEPPVGPTQNGERHLQIALHLFEGRGLHYGRLPLRFQKQFRLGEYALANHARALAPGAVKLCSLPRIAAVLHECGGHALAVVRTDSRHRHQILHRDLRGDAAFAYVTLDRLGQ
jgi:hypothetical protein